MERKGNTETDLTMSGLEYSSKVPKTDSLSGQEQNMNESTSAKLSLEEEAAALKDDGKECFRICQNIQF